VGDGGIVGFHVGLSTKRDYDSPIYAGVYGPRFLPSAASIDARADYPKEARKSVLAKLEDEANVRCAGATGEPTPAARGCRVDRGEGRFD